MNIANIFWRHDSTPEICTHSHPLILLLKTTASDNKLVVNNLSEKKLLLDSGGLDWEPQLILKKTIDVIRVDETYPKSAFLHLNLSSRAKDISDIFFPERQRRTFYNRLSAYQPVARYGLELIANLVTERTNHKAQISIALTTIKWWIYSQIHYQSWSTWASSAGTHSSVGAEHEKRIKPEVWNVIATSSSLPGGLSSWGHLLCNCVVLSFLLEGSRSTFHVRDAQEVSPRAVWLSQ